MKSENDAVMLASSSFLNQSATTRSTYKIGRLTDLSYLEGKSAGESNICVLDQISLSNFNHLSSGSTDRNEKVSLTNLNSMLPDTAKRYPLYSLASVGSR